jgi:hypothetical protein
MLTALVVLPTPPFWLVTEMTVVTVYYSSSLTLIIAQAVT